MSAESGGIMREQQSEQAGVREPRTHHEDVIRGLFAETLGMPAERIGVDAGFSALSRAAPDDRLAAQLAARVGAAFGVELAAETIFEQQTAQRLGAWVEESAKRLPQGRPLPLRPKGRGVPLFCIHPSSGFGRPYRVLLQHLAPELSVYAIEARGIQDGDVLPATLAEMCADYIDQIRSLQAEGPYRLLGWSFGAIPAHAIATQMQARGLQVDSLVLIDGFPFDGTPWVEQLVAGHRDHWGQEMLSFREVAAASDERKAVLLERLCAIKRNNVHLQSYQDRVAFDGDALLVDCGPHPFSWADYVSGTLHVLTVELGHNALMTPEAAAVYAPRIADYLERAGRGGR